MTLNRATVTSAHSGGNFYLDNPKFPMPNRDGPIEVPAWVSDAAREAIETAPLKTWTRAEDGCWVYVESRPVWEEAFQEIMWEM